jgi:tetratricopeptide (TPR) repeat protein
MGRGRAVVAVAGWWLASGCPSFEVDARQRAEGHYLRGTAAYLRGDFEEALEAFEAVRKDAPDDPRLPAAVGEVYLSQGKLLKALEQFDLALARDPRRGTSWSRKGYVLAQLGRREQARAALARALELSPGDFNALEQMGEIAQKEGRVAEAAAFYARAGEAAPEERRPDLYLRAAQQVEPVDPRQALAVLQGAEAQGVRSAELHSQRGDLEVRLSDFAAARTSYRKAAALAGSDPVPWEMVGRLSERLGEWEEAERAYQASLAVRPTASVHAALGRLSLRRGDRDGGVAALDAALAVATGEEVRESLELSDLLAAAGRGDDALRLLEQVAREPGADRDTELQLRTARLARQLRHPERAAAACERLRRGLDGGAVPTCP